MTALLDAIARVFIAPRAEGRLVAAPAPAPSPPAVTVCGVAAEPLACALALLLAGPGPGVLCAWGAVARRAELPPTVRARRLAASMRARSLAARASGRLVVVTLDADAQVAAAEAGRAAAAAADAPVVIALGGPRDEAFGSLLGTQDLAVIAGAGGIPDELVRLGVESLAAACGAAVVVPALASAAAWPARAGLFAGPGARRALGTVIALLSAEREVTR